MLNNLSAEDRKEFEAKISLLLIGYLEEHKSLIEREGLVPTIEELISRLKEKYGGQAD